MTGLATLRPLPQTDPVRNSNITDFSAVAPSAEMLSLLEHSERSVIVMDTECRILWFNSRAARTLSRHYGEPLKAGYTYWDYIGSDRNQRFRRNFEQALKGRTLSTERKLEGQDGRDLWIDGRFSPLNSDGGRIAGVIYSFENITERKRNEQENLYRENVIRAVESNVSQAFVLVDGDDGVVSLNPAATGMLVTDPTLDDAEGRSIHAILPPSWKERVQGGLKVARTGGTVVVEFERGGRDQRIIEVRFCPVHDRDNASMVSMWAADITDKRRAERELRFSEDNLRSVFNSSSQTFYLLDHELNVMAFNEAAALVVKEQYGRKLRVGVNVADITPPERMPQFLAEAKRAFSGQKVQVEKHFSNRGREYWFERHINPIRNKDGVIDRIALWSIDITERKRTEEALRDSEARFRQLAEIMPVGVYQCDRNGQTVYVNESIRRMMPSSISEIISGEWVNSVHPDDRERVRNRWKEIVRKQEPYQTEYRILDADGKVTYLFEQAIPLFNNHQEYAGHIGSVIDLTVQQTNQQLRQQKEVVEHSLKFRSDFLASMSHEIRTPLTGIIGMAELLLGSGLQTEQRKHVESIYSASQDLRSIVNDVLHLAELEAGKVVLREETFALDDLLRTLIERFMPEAGAKGISLTAENALQGAMLHTDRRRLTQILSNLTRNAVKFTDVGTVSIRASKAGERLRFSVTDTGIGIPSEDLPRLFTEFSKLAHTTAQNMEGTGLGLSISRKLADMLGGEVGVESIFGKGSTFWLDIPLTAVRDGAEQPPVPVEQARRQPSQIRTEVLLVEDNLINQTAFKAMLRKLGCRVTLASNGADAIDAFSNGRFDLIFMDVQMPVMDGITATERIRASGREVPPVIALSGNVLERDASGRLKVPMDDLLVKPVVSADLRRILEEWVKRPA